MHVATLQIHERRPQPEMATPPYHEWSMPDGRVWILGYRSGRDYLLRFPQIADYAVAYDGSSVEAWPAPEADRTTVEHLFINQVSPLAASRAGCLLLHASAVRIGDVCVAFAGETGKGKSTLATAFATTGNHLVADDGLQISWDGRQPVAEPGHASVRLWADSESALLPPASRRAPPVQYTTKARILAGETLRHHGQPLPLRCIYILGDGSAGEVRIERVRPSLAALEIVGLSFLLDIGESELLSRHFQQVSRLADAGVVYHLDYPRDYDALHEVCAQLAIHALQDPQI